MMGLGLYTGPLALVVLPESDAIEVRPRGYVRMGEALGLVVSPSASAPDARIMESIARLWAMRYPQDIVMVVEVLR